jgi:hypothetical protein
VSKRRQHMGMEKPHLILQVRKGWSMVSGFEKHILGEKKNFVKGKDLVNKYQEIM